MTGRPPADLTPARRARLARLARKLDALQAQVDATRAELARAAIDAREEGASLRAVGDATGLGRTTIHDLIAKATTRTEATR